MEFLAKSRIATVLVVVSTSSLLFAQSGGRGRRQDNSSGPDVLHIVDLSIVATERSLLARDRYTYVEGDQDRRLDAQGQLKSEKVDITKMLLVNGAGFEQLIERNGQPPSAEEQKKLDQDLEKLKNERRKSGLCGSGNRRKTGLSSETCWKASTSV
jgi:superfamily II DNA or RNA helicase